MYRPGACAYCGKEDALMECERCGTSYCGSVGSCASDCQELDYTAHCITCEDLHTGGHVGITFSSEDKEKIRSDSRNKMSWEKFPDIGPSDYPEIYAIAYKDFLKELSVSTLVPNLQIWGVNPAQLGSAGRFWRGKLAQVTGNKADGTAFQEIVVDKVTGNYTLKYVPALVLLREGAAIPVVDEGTKKYNKRQFYEAYKGALAYLLSKVSGKYNFIKLIEKAFKQAEELNKKIK